MQKYIQKWNPETRRYEEYKVPAEWLVTTYVPDLDQVINCAGCGREVIAGQTYTSRTIHTSVGFGYMVCYACYQKEWDEENE